MFAIIISLSTAATHNLKQQLIIFVWFVLSDGLELVLIYP